MGLGENIIVNGFMFCLDHGNEYCGFCTCDHRMCNNVQIEDDIINLSETFNLDERQPINVFALGGVHRGAEEYECRMHKKADCGNCFNWVKLICAEAEEAEKTERWLQKREKWANKIDP